VRYATAPLAEATSASRRTARATAPPTEREAWAILLTVEGLGPAGFAALLLEHGTALSILAAARRPRAASRLAATIASVEGRSPAAPTIGPRIVALARSPDEPLELLRGTDATIVLLDDPEYPARLRSIDLPPPVLFVRGDLAALSARHAVAIVGTRKATPHGRLVAARIAAAISGTGAVVVSGLAVGIDGAAHAAVVAEERPTVAVLGSGHGHLFPRSHGTLANQIVATGGAIVSEFWPDTTPATYTFPRRNRVISGLSDATIVVEAGEKSGALITAGLAMGQGRQCFLVPGPIDAPRSAGCLLWLRRYAVEARIVAGIPELIEDLGLLRGGDEPTRSDRRPSLEAELVELGLTAREVAQAVLVAATGHEPATVLSAITLLELRGLVTTTYGRYRAAGRLASAIPPTTGGRKSAGPGAEPVRTTSRRG
jgi:DNA processing protein